MKSLRFNLDALGMCASTLCMIHCMVFPFLLAALPLLAFTAEETPENAAARAAVAQSKGESSGDSHSHKHACCESECCATTGTDKASAPPAACCSTPLDFWVHVGLLAAVAPLGIVALGGGYWTHKRLGPLALGSTGVLLLVAALLFGHHLLGGRGEQVLTVIGSICMASAHLWNRRQCQCCRTPDLSQLVEIQVPQAEPAL